MDGNAACKRLKRQTENLFLHLLTCFLFRPFFQLALLFDGSCRDLHGPGQPVKARPCPTRGPDTGLFFINLSLTGRAGPGLKFCRIKNCQHWYCCVIFSPYEDLYFFMNIFHLFYIILLFVLYNFRTWK